MNHLDRLGLYTRTARHSSYPVIKRYSKSFSLASQLYPKQIRQSIACIYALVRVADEIVDGTARDAGLSLDEQAGALTALENDVNQALISGFSPNLVVHAFADEARAAGITTELTTPFFDSMRMDLNPVDFQNTQDYERYIYGSAEVIGLMCLKVFLKDVPTTYERTAQMESSACALGAAFQKINFLRDYHYDSQNLERSYFPGVHGHMNESQRDEIVADIRADLKEARRGIPLLPTHARLAVRGASAIFEYLLNEMANQPLDQLLTSRLSLTGSAKARIIAQELLKR